MRTRFRLSLRPVALVNNVAQVRRSVDFSPKTHIPVPGSRRLAINAAELRESPAEVRGEKSPGVVGQTHSLSAA
jgi:hypothetical protein